MHLVEPRLQTPLTDDLGHDLDRGLVRVIVEELGDGLLLGGGRANPAAGPMRDRGRRVLIRDLQVQLVPIPAALQFEGVAAGFEPDAHPLQIHRIAVLQVRTDEPVVGGSGSVRVIRRFFQAGQRNRMIRGVLGPIRGQSRIWFDPSKAIHGRGRNRPVN